jgi:hypothetical protein
MPLVLRALGASLWRGQLRRTENMSRTLFDISQDLHGLADHLNNLEGDD